MAKQQDPKTGDGSGALAGASGIVDPDKLKNIAGGDPAAPVAAPAPATPAVPAAPAAVGPRVGGPPAVDPNSSAAPAVKPAVDPFVVKTAMGTKVYGAGDSIDVVLSSFEDVQGYAKAFGVEIKEVNDLQNVLKEYDVMKKNTSVLESERARLNNYERTLNALPVEVNMILNAALNQQDYQQVITNVANKGAFNFEKTFDAYNEKEMINHYSGKNYSKQEFDDMEEDQYKALRDMAGTKYETAQVRYKQTIEDQQRATALTQQKFNNSVEVSIAQLKAAYPSLDEPKIQRVQTVMTADLQNTLFNDDNTYKPDAAERIAMLEFGKETIAQQEVTIGELVQKYHNVGASQATEKILLASDVRPVHGTGEAPSHNVLAEEVHRQTSFLTAK